MELLVVMGIIGVLSSILLMSIGRSSDSARAAKCRANLRMLAVGANSIAMKTGLYPFASSLQRVDIYRAKTCYYEVRGWISWLSMSHPFDSHPTSPVSVRNATYDLEFANDDGAFAITNGTMWTAVDKNHSVYLCPTHSLAYQRANSGKTPIFSYVMNSYFGYDYSEGQRAVGYGMRKEYGHLDRADRIAMFAELPINDPDSGEKMTFGGDATRDPTLQFKATIKGEKFGANWNGTPEFIGYNHPSGRNGHCGHVAFADGHVESLVQRTTKNGLSHEELTALLCAGRDYSFDGKSYEIIEETD